MKYTISGVNDIGGLFFFLKNLKIPHATEREMQEAIAQAFVKYEVPHSREHRLSSKDVIDFLVFGEIGIECKIKGQPKAIHRQAERYLKHDEVKGIIVVTAKHMGTTGSHNGKPILIGTIKSS